MPIITISRGSYSRGKAIAEKVASKLGYECLSRDLLLETSKEFNIPEIKLERALHDAPSVLDRFTHGKERYLCHLRKSLLQYAVKGNMVYHGLAGQHFLSGVPHIFKLRITADMNARVHEEMSREDLDREEALHLLAKDDNERRKWGMMVYGIDIWDCRLYDMVLHIGTLTIDDASDIICHAVQKQAFQETPESRKMVANKYLAAQVKSAIINILPTSLVEAEDGIVTISTAKSNSVITHKVTTAIQGIEGVKDIQIIDPKAQKQMINPFHNIS